MKVTDKMRQVRRDLQSYQYYIDTRKRFEEKLLVVLHRLNGVHSPILDSPMVDSVSMGGKSDNYYRDIELEALYTTEIKKLDQKLNDINSMLDRLTRSERAVIEEIFFKRTTYADYADANDYSVSGVQYKVNRIIQRIAEEEENV